MNNYNYMNYNWYYPMNRNNYFMSNNNYNNNLFSPEEGFEKGNMFTNLYSEYKNYKPIKLTPKNEQEKQLLDIQEICFAAHELNLYLDIHPEDQTMMMLFKDYCKKVEELTSKYEEMYGPMTVNGDMSKGSFNWVKDKWPWEVRNV